ncbi:hypothetical protein B0H16DRAFT_1466316 [Mycena metata]|uniref:Uncharacterized protein n=1 Tax=Mycena metata TaxID=1033252 RepID=A0AAD7I975_9AGAR|nr:hypothetical protein B0H16DRAFT_1466316 [Mycena metata]
MARGRPPLDAAIKLARRRESVQKYREKSGSKIPVIPRVFKFVPRNFLKLNEFARIRMQRNRATIAASDEDTQRRVRAQNELEEVSHRKARKMELNPTALPPPRKVFPSPRAPVILNESARRRGKRVPPPQQNLNLGNRVPPPQQDVESDSEGDGTDEDEHAGTPVIREPTLAEQREANRARRPSTCAKCYEVGCAGCACLCEASDIWVEHGGHYFPTCKMCGGEECSGCKCSRTFKPASLLGEAQLNIQDAVSIRASLVSLNRQVPSTSLFLHKMSFSDSPPSYTAAPWPSTPSYHAAHGFEDINLEEYTGTFYAVITDNWQGFAISKFPHAITWSAEGWSSFKTRWYSTPPSSPSSTVLSISRSPSPSELSVSRSPSPSPPTPPSIPPASPPPPPPVSLPPITREELMELAAFRPGPGPTSSRRLEQQFARVLGPEAVRPRNHNQDAPPPLEPAPTTYVDRRRRRAGDIYDSEEDKSVPREPSRRMRRGVQQPEPEPVRTFHSAAHNPLRQADIHAFYAVSGVNCIFTNKERAIAVWRKTPNADFFLNDDEDAVWEFLRGG